METRHLLDDCQSPIEGDDIVHVQTSLTWHVILPEPRDQGAKPVECAKAQEVVLAEYAIVVDVSQPEAPQKFFCELLVNKANE